MKPARRRRLSLQLAKKIAEMCDEYTLNRGWNLSAHEAMADLAIDCARFAADLGVKDAAAFIEKLRNPIT